MSSELAGILRDKAVQIGAAASLIIGAAVGLLFWTRRKRPSDEEIERRRRLDVTRAGRVTDGMVTEVHDQVIQYTYSLRGIEYNASQDMSGLEPLLPSDRQRVIGAASLKYMEQNPANSIVLSEEWSGLRFDKRLAVDISESVSSSPRP